MKEALDINTISECHEKSLVITIGTPQILVDIRDSVSRSKYWGCVPVPCSIGINAAVRDNKLFPYTMTGATTSITDIGLLEGKQSNEISYIYFK